MTDDITTLITDSETKTECDQTVETVKVLNIQEPIDDKLSFTDIVLFIYKKASQRLF